MEAYNTELLPIYGIKNTKKKLYLRIQNGRDTV
jgi:hypothetical protein